MLIGFWQQLGKFYLRHYQFLVVIFLIVLIFSYMCFAYDNKLIEQTLVTYAQTIFVGLITFSIPFLWNAYQRLLEYKNKARGDGIENILAKEFYEKAVMYFEASLLYPTAIITFLGIVISPFLHFLVLTIFTIASCIFFLLQTKIYNWVEERANTNLRSYLESKNPSNPDWGKAFKELWQMSDTTLEKDSLRPNHLLDIFVKKINELLQ